MHVESVAAEIDARLHAMLPLTVEPLREVRRELTHLWRHESPDDVVSVSMRLADRWGWFAWELVHFQPGALELLHERDVVRLAGTLDSWERVDGYCRYISGPVWRIGGIDDTLVQRWARHDDRWWRRAALVSTVPLNLRAAGGTGDTTRTIAICEMLVDDRDDMVVKAMSWALRALTIWDRDAVERFLAVHRPRLAGRVTREVRTKLDTGLKNRRR